MESHGKSSILFLFSSLFFSSVFYSQFGVLHGMNSCWQILICTKTTEWKTIYTHTYIYVCVCVYTYINIYMCVCVFVILKSTLSYIDKIIQICDGLNFIAEIMHFPMSCVYYVMHFSMSCFPILCYVFFYVIHFYMLCILLHKFNSIYNLYRELHHSGNHLKCKLTIFTIIN